MIGELVCPDCGGVVGATEPTEAGMPCRCFADGASPAMLATMSGSVVGRFGDAAPSPGAAEPSADGGAGKPGAAPVVVKVCRICGQDVAGQRRVKDSKGYYCVPCAREEEKRENQGRVRCRVCGKLVKEENLTDYEGTRMCPKCHEERTTMRRQEIKRMGFQGARFRDDQRQVFIVLIVLGALLVIILAGMVINHFRH